eukprot:2369769-Pleurochrysis_carterae.AAC.3
MAARGAVGAAAERGALANSGDAQNAPMPDFLPPYVMATPAHRPGVVTAQLATANSTAAGTSNNGCVLAWQKTALQFMR